MLKINCVKYATGWSVILVRGLELERFTSETKGNVKVTSAEWKAAPREGFEDKFTSNIIGFTNSVRRMVNSSFTFNFQSALSDVVLSVMALTYPCSNACYGIECPHLLNEVRKASEKQRDFMQDLEDQTLKLGRANEVKTLEEANNWYILQHYPGIASNCYCWPIVYKMQSPHKTTEQIQKDVNSCRETKTGAHRAERVYNKRRGDIAEYKVINMFQTMFLQYSISSFTISSYNWKGSFLQGDLKDGGSKEMRRKFKQLHPNAGEVDLIIAIPNKCILLVEVKSANMSGDIVRKVGHALQKQCAKHLDILSTVLADVSNGCYIPVISVVALPNAQGTTVTQLYCERCSSHLVTKEDLEVVEQLHSWYQKLMSQYPSEMTTSQFHEPIFEKLIARLVGPSSVKKFETTSDAIQGTVSSISSMNEEYYLLTPQQVHAHRQLDEKFVWIRGVPGSGKTILGLSKVDSIIKAASEQNENTEDPSKRHVLYIINGSSPGQDNSCLMQFYRTKFGAGNGNCKVCVRESHEIENYTCILQIPEMIESLQMKHKDEIVHILVEECQMKIKNVKQDEFTTKWRNSINEDTLGNVWIIQNSFAAKQDSTEDDLPNFQIIELDKILRMSKQNINFLNILLDQKYSAGHEITGTLPVVYRMSCICSTESIDKYNCPKCYQMRLIWMLRTAINEIPLNDSMAVCVKNAFITSSFKEEQSLKSIGRYYGSGHSPLSVNELPNPANYFPALYFASSIGHFTGCERSHVFVEFDYILQDGFPAMESLTRALGQMVLLDGGYCHEKDRGKYLTITEKVQEAEKKGMVKIPVIKDIDIERAMDAFKGYLATQELLVEGRETNEATATNTPGKAQNSKGARGKQTKQRIAGSEEANPIDETILQDCSDNTVVVSGVLEKLEKQYGVLKQQISATAAELKLHLGERHKIDRNITERLEALENKMSEVEDNVRGENVT